MAPDKEIQELREKSYEKICQFFDLLEQEDLLIKNSDVVSDDFINVFMRINNQHISTEKKLKLFEDKEKLEKFLKSTEEYG